jgi:hypothetical protein
MRERRNCMAEHWWHKKVREEVFSTYNPPKAYQSHSDYSKLYLFRTENLAKPTRVNCLSDADIVVFDPSSKKIAKVIEIETALNPKKIIGIILTTHLCDRCSYREERGASKEYLELKDIALEIIYRRAPARSKKDLKLNVFEPIIKKIIQSTEGSIARFPEAQISFKPHD